MKHFVIIMFLSFVTLNSLASDKQRQTPCRNIVKACKAAGFSNGKKTKGNVYRDCVEKIIKGETIEGVQVEKSDIEACLNKKKQ